MLFCNTTHRKTDRPTERVLLARVSPLVIRGAEANCFV